MKMKMKANIKQLMLLGVCTMSVAMALPASAHTIAYAANYSKEFTNYTERNVCISLQDDGRSNSCVLFKFPENAVRDPDERNRYRYTLKDLKQTPVIIDGRTFVPMRAIFEELGCTVEWDKATKTVTISRDGIAVELAIGSTTMGVNKNGTKSEVILDAAPVVINGNTMLPLRAPAEVFGYTLEWNSSNGHTDFIFQDGTCFYTDGEINIRDSVAQKGYEDFMAESAKIDAENEAKRAAEQAEKDAWTAKGQAGYDKLGELHKEYLKKGKLTPEQFNDEVFKCINIFRTYIDLGPLTRHPLLDEAAAIRAPEVLIKHGHDRPDGRSYSTAVPGLWNQETYSSEWGKGPLSAEILHYEKTEKTTPASTVQHWLESFAHGTLIVQGTVEAEDDIIGIGTAFDDTHTAVVIIDVNRGPGSKH